MATLNRAMLIGRLTHEPEVRTLPSGKTVAKFRLAVGRSKKLPDGTWDNSQTTYIDCEAWHNPDQKRNIPQLVQQYVQKGNEVYCDGALKEDQWEDKQTGQKRSKMKLVIDNIELLGGKNGGGDEQAGQRQPREGYRDPAEVDEEPAEAGPF